MKSKVLVFFLITLVLFNFSTVSAEGQKETAKDEKPLIGFITNGPYEFWTYSAAAVEILKKDLNVDIEPTINQKVEP